ncbi:MAG: hypothetical protein ACI37T_02285 [Candidatus Gastranaerophilaceae bacterium]
MVDKKKISLYPCVFLGSFIILYMFSVFTLNPAIDTGRELYIPYRMLNGEVLYKDIFNIYGPLSYQLNTLAYKIFGVKIHSLRIFGILNLMLLISSVWLILKEFFNKYGKITNFSKNGLPQRVFMTFCVLTICSTSIFNYILPYSFAMTYGLCFFVLSLLFFIKFSKTDMSKYAYLACIFAGGAFCCKYEFTGYLIFLLIYILLCKKIETKNVLFSILMLVLIPFISFGSLFLQGMSFNDLAKTSEIMKIMANTYAIKYLYTNFTGTYFNLKVFGICFAKTLMLAAIGTILYFAQKICKTDKFLTVIVYLFAIIGTVYVGTAGFSLFAIINALLFFIYFKKIYQNKPVFIYMLSAILLSLKTFFAVNIETYGIYTLPFLIFSIYVFLENIDFSKNEETKMNIKNSFTFIIFVLICLFVVTSSVQGLKKVKGYIGLEHVKNINYYEIITKTIYTYPYISEPLNKAIEYIEKNTKLTDKVVVLPETQFLNFVTKRPADNLYDSLTPMYFETFGEDNIIEHFEETKPEYFIINNRNTADYGKKYICDDYGKQFCIFVNDNYEKVETFGENLYILQIFKRKDLL